MKSRNIIRAQQYINFLELQFKIKLSELHPFFKGTEGKLLPKEIINDLRIELDTNLVNKVFTQGAAPISEILTAQISKCELQLALVRTARPEHGGSHFFPHVALHIKAGKITNQGN